MSSLYWRLSTNCWKPFVDFLQLKKRALFFFALSLSAMYYIIVAQLQRVENNANIFIAVSAIVIWKVLQYPPYGELAVLAFLLVLYRVFSGQILYPAPEDVPRILTVVYTFPGSPRYPEMEAWLSQMNISYTVEFGHRFSGSETVSDVFNMVNLTTSSNSYPELTAKDSLKRFGAFLEYWSIVKRSAGAENEWLLLLEDDAEPLHSDFFRRVHSLTENVDSDLVLLDNRNAISWIHPSMIGGVCGLLIRRSMASTVADWLDFSKENIQKHHYIYDESLGEGCAAEIYRCSIEPLMKEGNVKTFFRATG